MSAEDELKDAILRRDALNRRITELRAAIKAAREPRKAVQPRHTAKRSSITGAYLGNPSKSTLPQFQTSRRAAVPTLKTLNLPPAYED